MFFHANFQVHSWGSKELVTFFFSPSVINLHFVWHVITNHRLNNIIYNNADSCTFQTDSTKTIRCNVDHLYVKKAIKWFQKQPHLLCPMLQTTACMHSVPWELDWRTEPGDSLSTQKRGVWVKTHNVFKYENVLLGTGQKQSKFSAYTCLLQSNKSYITQMISVLNYVVKGPSIYLLFHKRDISWTVGCFEKLKSIINNMLKTGPFCPVLIKRVHIWIFCGGRIIQTWDWLIDYWFFNAQSTMTVISGRNTVCHNNTYLKYP